MLLFSGNSNLPLAKKIAEIIGVRVGELEITTFPDNENRVRVIEDVVDQDVIIVQSTGITPNLFYIELFLIIDSLKRSGARTITLVVPYLGYQRQDHIFRDGEAVSLEVIINILESLGVTKVISLDLHSVRIPELFQVPVVHLSAIPLFAEEIKKMNPSDTVLVSPDMGGIARIKKLSESLNNMPYVSIVKDRDLATGNIESTTINGDIKKTAIIVDDVISTGGTIVAAAKLLEERGVENVYVMATHGIFAGNGSAELQNSNVKKVIITDSIKIPDNKLFEKLEIISIAKAVAKELSA